MRVYDRLLAGWVWLSKFTIFSPTNLNEDESRNYDVIPWGNYAVGDNLYPNLFNVFVKYSPTADILLNKTVRLIFGNIPKGIKNQRTTDESVFTNTIQSLVKNAGRDSIMYHGSFVLWVGYDENGVKNQFKWIPIDLIRYVPRDIEAFPYTDNDNMIAIMDSAENKIESIYYPYEPGKIREQQAHFAESQESEKETNGVKTECDPRLKEGQILFYNTAGSQVYPDCIFNSMVPVLLTDAGVDTLLMSFLANSDLLKTYKKKAGATGADATNGLSNIFSGEILNSIWGMDRAQSLTATAQYGSDYLNTGVKAAGATDYLNIPNEEPIQNYVAEPKFPQFVDELSKIDERVARKFCIALEIPYEYIFKMESGVINQDNREVLIKEINVTLDDSRETFENVINEVLKDSIFDWRLSIRPIGEGKEDVADANENITK